MNHYDDEREADVKPKKKPVKRKPVKKSTTKKPVKKRLVKDDSGRPPVVLTEEQIIQVESLAAVLTTEQIADYFGIARRTFYDVMARQDEVSARYKKGRAKAIGSVSKSLLQKAIAGDNTAAIFYLKTQAGWKETTVVDNTSSDGSMSNLNITIVSPNK